MTVRTTYGRRVATACAVAITAALALSGCAAGQQAQTDDQYSVVDGSSADVGQIGIRDAGVASPSTSTGYAAGSDAALNVSIVNNGLTADVLTAVSTTASTSTQLGSSSSVSESDASSASPSDGATSSPTESTSGSASSAPSSATTPANVAIPLPANTLVRIGGEEQPAITLTGLRSALIPGQTVPVTFTFRDAGSITLQLPIQLVDDSTGGETVDVEPSGAGE